MYNVPSAKRRKRKFSPLNLIPILDVVFILIFFLLSTAQIMKVFEIGSDLPVFKVSDVESQEKKKFSLKVKVTESSIEFINSATNEVIQKMNTAWDMKDFYSEVNKLSISLKNKNKEANRVVLDVDQKVNYQNLVKIMDNLRKDNTKIGKSELFGQMMFSKK